MAPPLIKVNPPEFVVRLESAIPIPPTAPPKVVVLEDFALKLNAPLSVLLNRMFPTPVSIIAFPERVTGLLKVVASFEVRIFTPKIASLATVKALLKLEEVVMKETPVPPALSVVVPVMAPPPVTLLTTMLPAPSADIARFPVVVIKSSSASVRLNPAPAVPRKTLTPVSAVMLTGPAALNAAPIKISDALETVSAARSAVFPTVPLKKIVPVPAVRPRLKPPLKVPPNAMSAPPPPMVLFIRLFVDKVAPPVPKFIESPELLMVAPRLEAAFPVKFMPALNRKVSPVASPSVTFPVLRKSTFKRNVFPDPVIASE